MVVRACLAALCLLAASGGALCEERSPRGLGAAGGAAETGVPVDVELILAVDVSWSMDRGEQEIQRNGYVAAFRDAEVQKAILEGNHGRVAVAFVEWAGTFTQNVVVPWTLIDSKEAADAFAYRLSVEEPDRERRTSISGALDFAVPMFADNGFAGLRRVIDISGDGPNNEGRPVAEARAAAIAAGITINGLPLMTSQEDQYGGWGAIADLDTYYAQCVIGGPAAFMIPVHDWQQFPQAIRRKLVMELADLWPSRPRADERPILKVADGPGADCLVGEKQWQQRQDFWNK
ncbi:hypothetical protein GCM10011390_01490 [Aureimonas endophytica]|uniref:DUF1194 domain-containing protein n=1 Tax=Aureimonas endophytica TaxID=2027858 RepID=A0A916ZCS1_9HYPH|nr:DUF1194 domain-containing protein [Aureimonas endophytica]GGD86585.1 hypothetical protein GCM10011390_01490 [Aureimonas endophytica]